MKIDGFGTIKQSSTTSKRAGTSAAGSFADILAAAEATDAPPPAPVTDLAAASALSNLLALQEISEEDIHRKKLVQQGDNMLDELEKLRRQLLLGAVPAHVLQDIKRQLNVQKQSVNDHRLNEIIEDIELRAAVELAKLQMVIKSE